MQHEEEEQPFFSIGNRDELDPKPDQLSSSVHQA